MSATIGHELTRTRRELKTRRRERRFAAVSHHARPFHIARHEVQALERAEEALLTVEDRPQAPICPECERQGCPGTYKPDSSHELAF